MAFLLDTTVHILWGRGNPDVAAWLDDHAGEGLHTSAMSVAEVYSGVSAEQRRRWEEYFERIAIEPIDRHTAVFAGQLRYTRARGGFQIHLADSLIAATAILNDWPVVTSNIKDFSVAGASTLQLPVP
jgi:predicted nucleic acid-binding protein